MYIGANILRLGWRLNAHVAAKKAMPLSQRTRRPLRLYWTLYQGQLCPPYPLRTHGITALPQAQVSLERWLYSQPWMPIEWPRESMPALIWQKNDRPVLLRRESPVATSSRWGLVIGKLLPKTRRLFPAGTSDNPLQTRLSLCIRCEMQLTRHLLLMPRRHLPLHKQSLQTQVPLLSRLCHDDCLNHQMRLSTRHRSSDVETPTMMLLSGTHRIGRARSTMCPRFLGI
jgi:hypothetical protein